MIIKIHLVNTTCLVKVEIISVLRDKDKRHIIIETCLHEGLVKSLG